jgi:hypothetical protein
MLSYRRCEFVAGEYWITLLREVGTSGALAWEGDSAQLTPSVTAFSIDDLVINQFVSSEGRGKTGREFRGHHSALI